MLPDYDAIVAEVKRNQALLDSCSRHEFTRIIDLERPILARSRCERCGGTVDHHARRWYAIGLAHGLAAKDQ